MLLCCYNRIMFGVTVHASHCDVRRSDTLFLLPVRAHRTAYISQNASENRETAICAFQGWLVRYYY